MNQIKKAAAVSLAGLMGLLVPATAQAASPEFARTAKEWAALQDNVLEYGEVPDLIEEYNVTVQNNQYEYNKFVKDYGKTREDIANEYQSLADDLESDISGDNDGSAMVNDLSLQLQADRMREQADDTVEDSQIYALTYNKQKSELSLTAKRQFIAYYRARMDLELAKTKKQILENNMSQTEAKRQTGMATQAEVLVSQEAVLTQEKLVSNLELEIEDTRQKLIVMLGWKGSAQPEIGELPAVSPEDLAAVNYETDKQTALLKNYTLQINRRKFDNALNSENKENIRKTVSGNEKQIETSLLASYQNLLTAQMSCEQAQADAETENRNMDLARQKWNAGLLTGYQLAEQEAALAEKQLEEQKASINLLESLETYRWDVNGLAASE